MIIAFQNSLNFFSLSVFFRNLYHQFVNYQARHIRSFAVIIFILYFQGGRVEIEAIAVVGTVEDSKLQIFHDLDVV